MNTDIRELQKGTTIAARALPTLPTMIPELLSAVVIGTMLPLGGVAAVGVPPLSMAVPRSPVSDGRVCVVTPIKQQRHRQQYQTQPFGNAIRAVIDNKGFVKRDKNRDEDVDDLDDVPQILQAFTDCNNGGTVVFPEGARYNIASRLNPVVKDVTVDWHGVWEVSTCTSKEYEQAKQARQQGKEQGVRVREPKLGFVYRPSYMYLQRVQPYKERK